MNAVSPADLRLLLPAVSPAAEGALYEQIVRGIERAVSGGDLAPESLLPSFRQLAEDLMVSVITVRRAYEELERAGIIYRRQGLGTFVAAAGLERMREVKLERARQLAREAAAAAREAGLNRRQVARLFSETLEETDDNPKP